MYIPIITLVLILLLFVYNEFKYRRIHTVLHDLKHQINNGILEKLYDTLREELSILNESTPHGRSMWLYFRGYMTITYENYKLVKLVGTDIFTDKTSVSMQTVATLKLAQSLADTKLFDAEFINIIKSIHQTSINSFFKHVQILLSQNASFVEIQKLIIQTFRENVRSIYSAYYQYIWSKEWQNK